ncbi:MAG: ADP-dependent glucokinase/phosphofructokinase [Treponema sp.]|jgi:ADP-dependent phosphofructokinase/glucokinase|nr:ADP-dependent glucokinase/phosphofructokinase [Treponema sp.]
MSEKILLGLGNNIDYEIRWDSAPIERMIIEYGLRDAELNTCQEIKNRRDLLVSILSFLKNGSGGECFVHSSNIIEDFSGNFEKKITLGGTAVRAAAAMRKLGCRSSVHLVTMNDHVRRFLPEDCEYFCSNALTSSWPHLIVQFTAGTRVHANDIHIETAKANRIIYTNDEDNALMLLHPELPVLLAGAKVFLISGFNAMRDACALKDRLRFLADMLEKQRPDSRALIFFEDACYHKPEMSAIVRGYLLKYIDIYSLNEDEFESYIERAVSWTDVRDVLEALADLHRTIPVTTLVVHTRLWALAYGKNCTAYRKALTGGITMAATRFRLGDDFTKEDYAETGRLPEEEAGRIFALEIEAASKGLVCCVPSFAPTEKNVTTIGLGDTFAGGFLPALI